MILFQTVAEAVEAVVAEEAVAAEAVTVSNGKFLFSLSNYEIPCKI
jgi:hypothetical protein